MLASASSGFCRKYTRWRPASGVMDRTSYMSPLSSSTWKSPTSSGRKCVGRSGPVAVPKATPSFTAWAGSPPADTYNGKQVLDYEGRPAFAELAILWALNDAGWEGVWIDNYSGVYRTSYWGSPSVEELPAAASALLGRIREAAGSRFGAWDVFCWRGPKFLCAESKRVGRDSIRATQVRWLQAALDVGMSVEAFLVVEWSIA
jgi:hypothetical protein